MLKKPAHKVYGHCCFGVSAGRNTQSVESRTRSITWFREGSCPTKSGADHQWFWITHWIAAGALKQPQKAAPMNKTWVRAVGLPCLLPQSSVRWKMSTCHSSLMTSAWIHDKWTYAKADPIISHCQAHTFLWREASSMPIKCPFSLEN